MIEHATYHEGMRKLQDIRETRPLADRLDEVTVRSAFTAEDRAFITSRAMMFVATADAQGHPECSYKGGLPGFIRVLDDRTLAFPDYDGNGMYRSWGNVLVNPAVGLLFLDFEAPKRLRVNGSAQITADHPLRAEFPGSVFIVRVTASMEDVRYVPRCSAGARPGREQERVSATALQQFIQAETASRFGLIQALGRYTRHLDD